MTDANAPGSDLQPKSAVSETVGAPARGYQIQVGAFATVAEAERQIAAAKGRAANVLSGHPSISLPAQKGARQIFRARFAGFDASNASVACAELRRFAIDCLVMKAD
jgi:D-alanyl-D-alanine carboxypeptidase